MRQLALLAWCAVILLGLAGCQNSTLKPDQTDSPISSIDTPIEEGNEFPQFLAGTWKADASKWQITLAPDGNVVSAIDNSGSLMVMAEGGLFQNGPAEGSFLYLVYGPWYTNYNPATRELNVTITISHFHMELPGGSLEGDIKYYITGIVSKNGKRWNVELYSYAKPMGQKPTDPELIKPEILIFRKVESD